MSDKLKTLGLILAFVCFVVLEVAFFSAAVSVLGILLWICGMMLGFYEIGTVEKVHGWFIVSVFWMLYNGVMYQFKDSYKTLKEHIHLWRKA